MTFISCNKKPLLAFFAVLVFLQVVAFLAINYCSYSINENYIFGYYNSDWWFTMVGIGLLVTILYYFKKIGLNLTALFAIIIAAVLSNLFERVFYGGAVDYINLFGLNVLNIADIIIVIGFFATIVYAIIKKKI